MNNNIITWTLFHFSDESKFQLFFPVMDKNSSFLKHFHFWQGFCNLLLNFNVQHENSNVLIVFLKVLSWIFVFYEIFDMKLFCSEDKRLFLLRDECAVSLWGSEEEMAGQVLLSRSFRGLFSPLLRSPLGMVTEANLLFLTAARLFNMCC